MLKTHLGKEKRIMVMVKALAYGVNDVYMTKFFISCGIDIFGVSYVDEGVTLRREGVCEKIFVMNALVDELTDIVEYDFELAVSNLKVIEELAKEAVKQRKVIKVHLHVDTGMNRFGCLREEALFLAHEILKFPSLKLEGLMTHFACAENLVDDAFSFEQVSCFQKVIKQLEGDGITIPWHHAANSSAALRFHLPEFNMVRLGISVYGIPLSQAVKESCPLIPSLSLLSRIVGINRCKEGDTISYGRTHTIIKKDARIAVLPLGYFDGINRNYSGRGVVMIAGKQAPMVGRICMDCLMVDISEIPCAKIGDPVLVFGSDSEGNTLPIETLAMSGNSIVHELITCLGPRIQRVFTNGRKYVS